MTITKQKECDQCDAVHNIEPVYLGGQSYDWIEISMVSWRTGSMFQGTMHFCSDKCLVRFIESKKAMNVK